MSLSEEDAAKIFAALKYFKRSAFKPQRWLMLLRGHVNLRSFFKTIRSVTIMKLSSQLNSLKQNSYLDSENIKPQKPSRHPNQLSWSGIQLSFTITENDPWYVLFMTSAGKTANQLKKMIFFQSTLFQAPNIPSPLISSRRYTIDKIASNVLPHYH